MLLRKQCLLMNPLNLIIGLLMHPKSLLLLELKVYVKIYLFFCHFFYRAVPSAVFSQPPIGQVGLPEEQVKCFCPYAALCWGQFYDGPVKCQNVNLKILCIYLRTSIPLANMKIICYWLKENLVSRGMFEILHI